MSLLCAAIMVQNMLNGGAHVDCRDRDYSMEYYSLTAFQCVNPQIGKKVFDERYRQHKKI